MIPAAPPVATLTPDDRQRIATRNAVALEAAWLVRLVLRRLSHVSDVRRADPEDLQQAAWLELVRAADRFDQAKGKLSTIALRRVRDATLVEAMRSATLVHVPPRVLAAMWRGDDPTADLQKRMECAEVAKAPAKAVEADDLAGNTMQELRRREEIAEADKTVWHLLHWLSPRDREIVRLRFGIGKASGEIMGLAEIGERVGLSRERVRQIICESLQRMRAAAPVACPDLRLALQAPVTESKSPKRMKKVEEKEPALAG